MAVLAAGRLGAGVHDLVLDAGRLAPAVYVVRVTVDDGRPLSRRVTVVR